MGSICSQDNDLDGIVLGGAVKGRIQFIQQLGILRVLYPSPLFS